MSDEREPLSHDAPQPSTTRDAQPAATPPPARGFRNFPPWLRRLLYACLAAFAVAYVVGTCVSIFRGTFDPVKVAVEFFRMIPALFGLGGM